MDTCGFLQRVFQSRIVEQRLSITCIFTCGKFEQALIIITLYEGQLNHFVLFKVTALIYACLSKKNLNGILKIQVGQKHVGIVNAHLCAKNRQFRPGRCVHGFQKNKSKPYRYLA